MSVPLAIAILIFAGLGFLAYYIIKKGLLPGRITTDYRSRSKILQAIRQAKAAVERDPRDAQAHFLLGKAFLADKREEQAFREYRSASRLGITGRNIPEIEFRETIAGLYVKFREPEEALREYVLLIKKCPENPEYYFEAGKLFPGRGRADLAEQYLRKAVSLNPGEERYRFELGVQYHHGKRHKEAAAEFDAVLKLNPSNDHAQFYLGKILKTAKDYSGAIPYLEKAARDQEYKLRALIELGGCYMSLRMMEKAIVELERAVNVINKDDESESLYARYFLAMCYEKTQEFDKAIAQWEHIYAQKKSFRDVGEKLTQYIEYRQENTERETTGNAGGNAGGKA
ncbi:MAG: tetratricopeptide repeat protein [Treponema sp.]|nr:tetratricopeptide repeat protein [Treponema sp.]